MSMEDVVDGVRRVVERWTKTVTPLKEDVSEGDTIITVDNSTRFQPSDEIMIRSGTTGETKLRIHAIRGVETIELVDPVEFDHFVSDEAVIAKTFNGQLVRTIYVGDPAVIPGHTLPAITINGSDKASEWITLEDTKETHNLEISIYVNDSTQEAGYRTLMRLTSAVERGLKKNLFPLVGDFTSTAITADVMVGDTVIKVASTSLLEAGFEVAIEDKYNQCWAYIKNIIDDSHVELSIGALQIFQPSAGATLILPHRRIFNSWPATIDYGFVHKGSLMKAAKIQWFGWENEVHAETVQDDTYIV